MKEKQIKRYTVGEEIFNSVTHGVGALLSVIGASVMVTLAASFGDKNAVISSVIFGLSLVILYTMSTLYHAFPFVKVKELFRIFDHASVPILIAGTYTPFCTIGLRGNQKGTVVIIVVWACALLCVLMNGISLEKTEKITLALYLAMGWAIVFVIKDVIAALPHNAFLLLLGGGLSYTIGVIFYKMTKVKYMHSVWHLFVAMGSLLHYLCVVIYVLPMTY